MSRPRNVLLALAVAAAAAASPRADGTAEVQEVLNERAGASLRLQRPDEDPGRLRDEVRSLLATELTAERAVAVALLNNRGLQATLRDLGVSQAELAQARLLPNPVFHGEVRFPGSPMEVGLAQDVTDFLLRPLRLRSATAHLSHTKLRVSHEVLALAAEVRSAFYAIQAAQQARAMRATIAEVARASADLAQRQYLAGNTSLLTLENGQAQYEEAKLDLAASELATVEARERLNRLMGAWGAETEWQVAEPLPELPEREPSPERLESLAVASRLDLAATEAEVLASREAVPLARREQWPTLAVGVHLEREPEGRRTIGPEFEVSLPLFNRGQAATAGARARLEQSLDRRAALAVDIRSEVRTAHARLTAARHRVLYYQDVVVPRRERIVSETQREYNFMLVGVYQLIQARREEIHARAAHIEAQRDYWLARTELERAVGTRLLDAALEERSSLRNGGPMEVQQ